MAHAAELRARNADFWDRAAPGWIRHADRQDELGRPLGAAALDELHAGPGERVLDVGCGCGGTTAELAAAVGPTGVAVGVDLSEAMVARARERFAGPPAPGPRFLAGDIETMGVVPGAPFDAVYSRMTLMLLPPLHSSLFRWCAQVSGGASRPQPHCNRAAYERQRLFARLHTSLLPGGAANRVAMGRGEALRG